MCIVDKIVCFRKLINRVIVANEKEEYNVNILCIYMYSCTPMRVSWDSPVIPFIETFILLLGRIVALRLFCET